jgi:hypothetical protein
VQLHVCAGQGRDKSAGNSRGRSAEYISLCGPSLRTKAKDFQFGHEHFHLLESGKALLHFSSIYLGQTVWVKGFIHTP